MINDLQFFQVTSLPKNGLEFIRDWRRQKTDSDRYTFLIEIGATRLGQIFKTEMSLLGDIIIVLYSDFKIEHCEEIVAILDIASTVNRFSLSLQFLSNKEVEACNNIFAKLEETLKGENRLEEQEERWNKLKTIYCVK